MRRALNTENQNYDYGKLLHLQILLALKELDTNVLKGIIGNTSGTFDLAGFVGHNTYNIHQFTQPEISYR